MQSNNIEYFNMLNDEDTAVVRLLHTTTDTIETVNTHTVEIGEEKKKRTVKCPGDDCPLCKLGDKPVTRIYIHLWDYADDKEKIWVRSDKIMDRLVDINSDWGDLSECVLKIKRIGNQFPKYDIYVLNAKNYAEVDKKLNDQKLCYRFYLTRSVDELKQFVTTGVMPKHESTFIPKEEYKKQKAAEAAAAEASENNIKKEETKADNFVKPNVADEDFDDPFMDTVVKRPRKI